METGVGGEDADVQAEPLLHARDIA
jgi:hypothetical protein